MLLSINRTGPLNMCNKDEEVQYSCSACTTGKDLNALQRKGDNNMQFLYNAPDYNTDIW